MEETLSREVDLLPRLPYTLWGCYTIKEVQAWYLGVRGYKVSLK